MKIKNSIKLIISTLILSSFIYSGSVTPVLGLRFNDIAGSTDLQGPSQTLGLKMDVGSGVYSGFDTNGTDFRIFVQQSFGTFGFGRNNDGENQFTVGGNYNILDNLQVSLDYVINRLTDNAADGDPLSGVPYDDEIRMSLSITF